EPLFDRVVEWRAVTPDETEALRPGVDMSIEVKQPQRASAARQRPQQRQRDRVVAAECHQMLNPRRLLLDLRERAGDVAVRNPEIADIGKIERFDLGPGCRMVVVDQHATRLTDRRWSEARPRPVRGAEIKWNPGDADRRVGAGALDREKGRS